MPKSKKRNTRNLHKEKKTVKLFHVEQNRLLPENCNKKHCKTCIFHPDYKKALKLSPERMTQIQNYLIKFEASHICHVTEKTCFGALELQAKTAFVFGFTSAPTVENYLETAKKYLK